MSILGSQNTRLHTNAHTHKHTLEYWLAGAYVNDRSEPGSNQGFPDTTDATSAPVSYCEPGVTPTHTQHTYYTPTLTHPLIFLKSVCIGSTCSLAVGGTHRCAEGGCAEGGCAEGVCAEGPRPAEGCAEGGCAEGPRPVLPVRCTSPTSATLTPLL